MTLRILCILMILPICSTAQYDYSRKTMGYLSTTNISSFQNGFVSIPVYTNNDSIEFFENPAPECWVVILIESLYRITSDGLSDETCFRNTLLSDLMRERPMIVSNDAMEKLKPFSISLEDGLEYLKMDTDSLMAIHADDLLFPDLLGQEFLPDYKSRCIMHHFIHSGLSLWIDDESGFLVGVRYE